MTLLNGVVEWHCQTVLSNGFVKRFCQAGLSNGIVKYLGSLLQLFALFTVFSLLSLLATSRDVWLQLTRPDTRLPQSRAGGQGPRLRSPDHLGRSSEAKNSKNPKK